MRFKMNRLCELAGVPLNSRRGRLLGESAKKAHKGKEDEDQKDEMRDMDEEDEGMREMRGGMDEEDEGMHYEGLYEEDEDEKDEGMRGSDMDEMRGMDEEDDDDDDPNEVVEIDEKELVQELRRARRIMREGKKIAARKKLRRHQKLQESQLKAVIDQEVKNIIKEMDLNLGSGWVYGNKKPKRSKKGYLNHGSFLKGMGFK